MLRRESDDFLAIRNGLIDRLLFVFAILVVVAAAGSVLRAGAIGFLPIMALHLFIAFVFVVLYFLRRKVTTNIKAVVIFGAFLLAGIAGLINFGLAGAGTMLLIGACVFSALLHTTHSAIIVFVTGLVVQAIIFFGVQFLGWKLAVAVTGYLSSPQAWINNLVAYTLISLSLIFIIDKFFTYLKTMSAVLQDAVEEKSQQLETSEILLASVINALPFGVFWKDTDLKFVGANQRFLQDIRIASLQEIVGKTDRQIGLPANKVNEYEFMDKEVLDTGEPHLGYVEKHFRENGEEYFTSANKVLITNKHGENVGILTTYMDITESKRMEQALREAKNLAEEASKAKSEFLATMSHEIRTPINGIMGLLELTLETELTDKQRDFIAKADLSAHTLLHIVNDILDISKIEAGKMEVETIPFSVNDVLVQLQNQIGHMAKAKELSFSIHCNGPVEKPVNGDPTKLLQILVNLCSNAIKFTSDGGVAVTVNAINAPDKLKLRIAVKDSGIGIDEDKQEKLFMAFSQADGSTTRRFGGTGLGLAIVKKMLEIQGGKIELVSVPDAGSTFTFFIDYPHSNGDVSFAPAPTTANLNGVKILLAEDNDINQMIASEMLQNSGATVSIANDGNEALLQLTENRFDVVLMDIQMPNLDGIKALQQIRENEQWYALPVIALTANVMAHEIKHYNEIGFSAHLGKPFQKEQLVYTIQQVLAES